MSTLVVIPLVQLHYEYRNQSTLSGHGKPLRLLFTALRLFSLLVAAMFIALHNTRQKEKTHWCGFLCLTGVVELNRFVLRRVLEERR